MLIGFSWKKNGNTYKSINLYMEDAHTQFVRVDQGGELARSAKFKELLLRHNCILEPTGTDAASENGLAEQPNIMLAKMTSRLLYLSGLPPTFWQMLCSMLYTCITEQCIQQ